MKTWFTLSVLLLLLAPLNVSADILKDYPGRWKYVEKSFWSGSSNSSMTFEYIVTVTKNKDGSYRSIGRESSSSGKISFREHLKPNKTATLENLDSDGKVSVQYSGKWSIRNATLSYNYISKPDSSGEKHRLTGSQKRISANKWTGSGTFAGTGRFTYTMTRLR